MTWLTPDHHVEIDAAVTAAERTALLRTEATRPPMGPMPSGGTAYRIFASSTLGDDSHSGLSDDQPVRTAGRIKELMVQRGMSASTAPAEVWFRPGDTWHEWPGLRFPGSRWSLVGCRWPGITPEAPPARFLCSPGANAFENTSVQDSLLTFLGLDIEASPEGIGIRMINEQGTHLHIHHVRIINAHTGIAIRAMDGVRIAHCCITDCQGVKGSGIQIEDSEDLVVERCYIARQQATIFSHGIYIQDNCRGTARVRHNIIESPGSHGVMCRMSVEAHSNVFADCPIGLYSAGELVQVRHNVFAGRRDINFDTPRGYSLDIGWAGQVEILQNVFTGRHSGPNACAIRLDPGQSLPRLMPVEVLWAGNHVCDWHPEVPIIRRRSDLAINTRGHNGWEYTMPDGALIEQVYQRPGG